MKLDLALAASQGGGVYVCGVANFEGCNIHDNTASDVCLHLELSLNLHPSPMELDLALAARRAVASMSAGWLALKAVISMTTPRARCAP